MPLVKIQSAVTRTKTTLVACPLQLNSENCSSKRKNKKNSESSNSGYSVELTGLLLILIGFIGFGFGLVGSIIKKFAMFLSGIWWMLLLIFIIIIGLYMLIKRKAPKFISARLIGLYVVFGVILVASHFGFINNCKKFFFNLNEN